MTTTISISNFGPKIIKVEIQGRDKHGRFREQSEVNIDPNTFRSFNVYQNQSIQIFESSPETSTVDLTKTEG